MNSTAWLTVHAYSCEIKQEYAQREGKKEAKYKARFTVKSWPIMRTYPKKGKNI